jgi:hypothetical protein
MYILRIILFYKTVVSNNDCLDPAPQAIAGLRHGVPVEGPHHLFYLLDQILILLPDFAMAHTSDSPHSKK